MYEYYSNYLENILIKTLSLDKDTSDLWQELIGTLFYYERLVPSSAVVYVSSVSTS